MREIFTLDIGGTNIKYAVISENGEIRWKNQTPTPKTLDSLLTFINKKVTELDIDVEGIAISSPGAVSKSGVIYGGSAIPYIHGPNMREVIAKAAGLPVEIENDANCAALAEVWQGNAQKNRDVAIIVLGTGIGGAIIKNGVIHKGAHIHGGEFGYMVLNPSNMNGDMRTFSEVASTHSLVKRVARLKQEPLSAWSGKKIFELAANGDLDCIQAIDDFYQMLAIGVYNIQYIYDPEVILIGGGISNREEITRKIDEKITALIDAIDVATIKPVMKRCHFVADANLVGAAYHYMQQHSDGE